MINYLRNALLRRYLRRHKIKVALEHMHMRRNAVLVLEEHVSLNVQIAEFARLEIGAHTYIRSDSELWNVSRIGRYCSIGNGVVLGQPKRNHPLDWVSTHPLHFERHVEVLKEGPPLQIGHDVWIGRDAMIMDGIAIGTGAAIGARSVVTRDVPPYAIVAGSPARIIKYRHNDEINSALLRSAWWNIAPDVLASFPLDDPVVFLRAIDTGEHPRARYERFSLSRVSGHFCAVNAEESDPDENTVKSVWE